MTVPENNRTAAVTPAELIREAARVFPKLANDFGYIRVLSSAPERSAEGYGLYTRRNGYCREILKLEGRIVEAFELHGWTESSGDKYALTDEGLLWLRRHLAGSEPFRQQHQLTEQTEREIGGVRRPVVVNEGESPLGWLRRRKGRGGGPLITDAQYEAGERLRSEFERAQLMPSVTSNWDSMAPSRRMRRAAPEGPAALNDNALASRERVTAALDAVGPELAGILVDVCCYLVGLSEAEKCRGWPQRSGKIILQIALTRLARHYGLERDEEGSAQAWTRMRHWGTDDFRPSLDQWR